MDRDQGVLMTALRIDRRALELLASSRDGCTEALMFANGFTAERLLELVRAGLVRARRAHWSQAA